MYSFAAIYSKYYDLFYKDKDYPGECDFIEKAFAKYANRRPETILDVGCGSGGHALPLIARGYHVLGVDLSEYMLRMARAKAQGDARARFQRGDVRVLDLGEQFDACISIFAVMSYQATNEDMLAALRNTGKHIRPGGIFIFDVWSGIAVLSIFPSTRIREYKDGDKRVLRLVQPALDVSKHIVEVRYHLLVIQRDRIVEEAQERHRIRYWFPEELRLYLDVCGFSLLEVCPFPKLGCPVGSGDWNIAVIARAT